MARPRPIHFALNLLFHDRKRLVLSTSAIAVAVIIMFMQMGFFNGFNDSQAILLPRFNADLVVMNSKRVHMNKWDDMDRCRLGLPLAFPEVREVVPVYCACVGVKSAQSGMARRAFITAFPPDSDPFKVTLDPAAREALKHFGTALYDTRSRHIFGDMEVGDRFEIGRQTFVVGGHYELGPNFSYDGMLMLNSDTWIHAVRPGGAESIAFGLVRTRPGTDVRALRDRIQADLPPDMTVLTPEDMRQREIAYTIKASPLGAIFGIGLIIGFIIGIIICQQILFNEINDHLPQYATLKALGFSDRYLTGIVLQEAAYLAVMGFVPGLLGSLLFYWLIEHFTRIVMFFTPGRVLLNLGLTVAMCLVAAHLAAKDLTRNDPADLF